MEGKKLNLFKTAVWKWYAENKRDFPWRKRVTPYRVFVSEIMLQQTQAPRVAALFPEFIRIFPSFSALAQASNRDVLAAWQGLGYNRRALALKRAAKIIIEEKSGRLPSDFEELIALPGIGKATRFHPLVLSAFPEGERRDARTAHCRNASRAPKNA